ncbi:hypothetical protein OH492_14305 [Vibrio chagasii]|nr:hypothetical protein [Vibrio chagasii]
MAKRASTFTPMMAHNIVSFSERLPVPIVDQTQQQESSNTQNNAGSSNTTTKDQPMQSNEDELLINCCDHAKPPVNIRVKIAEVSRNVSKQIWGSSGVLIAGGVDSFHSQNCRTSAVGLNQA